MGEAITVASNDEATALNERIRTGRVESGEVDDTVTATGSDDLPIGAGDLIQTRKNDTALGVADTGNSGSSATSLRMAPSMREKPPADEGALEPSPCLPIM